MYTGKNYVININFKNLVVTLDIVRAIIPIDSKPY